jgi:hypothetical protein
MASKGDPFEQFHGVGFDQSILAELLPLGVSSVITNNVAHVDFIRRTRSQRQVLLIQYASVLYARNRLHALDCVLRGEQITKLLDCSRDESRKRVIGIMASILAARKLAQNDGGKRMPATMSAIADAVTRALEIMREIDSRWPLNR